MFYRTQEISELVERFIYVAVKNMQWLGANSELEISALCLRNDNPLVSLH